MKIKLPPFLDSGIRIISLFLLFFVGIELDKFSFGMMNATNTVSFGLGVSLFLGGNLLIFYTAYKITYSLIKIKKNESNH
jgi:hypothetical protein